MHTHTQAHPHRRDSVRASPTPSKELWLWGLGNHALELLQGPWKSSQGPGQCPRAPLPTAETPASSRRHQGFPLPGGRSPL